MHEVESTAPETGIPDVHGWTQLLTEAAVLGIVSLLLLFVAALTPDQRSDTGFFFFLILALHAFGVGRFWIRAETFLAFECPSCLESFHGLPDRIPRPYRRHCAQCEASL
jgi:hypothetical protein